MVDYPQQNRGAVRGAAPVAGNSALSTPYPFNEPQISSTSSRPGQSNAGSCFPASNLISPHNSWDQRNSPAGRPSLTPTPTSYPLACGQSERRPRYEISSTQQAMYNTDPRDGVAPPSFHCQYSGHIEHRNDQASPNWSTAPNLGFGRSLSVSEGIDSGNSYISQDTNGSSNSYPRPYGAQSYKSYRDHTDDEESDNMSDGIASNEGVYSSSGSDRDLFDDDDGDNFGIDSDEEYDSSDS